MNCTETRLWTKTLDFQTFVLWFQLLVISKIDCRDTKKAFPSSFSQIIRWTLKTNRCRKEDLLLAERLEEDPPTKHLDNGPGTLISKVVN